MRAKVRCRQRDGLALTVGVFAAHQPPRGAGGGAGGVLAEVARQATAMQPRSTAWHEGRDALLVADQAPIPACSRWGCCGMKPSSRRCRQRVVLIGHHVTRRRLLLTFRALLLAPLRHLRGCTSARAAVGLRKACRPPRELLSLLTRNIGTFCQRPRAARLGRTAAWH